MKAIIALWAYVWIFWLHRRPHIEEIYGILLLRRFGEELYPGISTGRLKICFWRINNPRLKKFTTAMLLARRRIVVGLRVADRSDFDEHGTATEDRKMGECSATLIAKKLKIQDDPQIQVLLEAVRRNDCYGYGGATDLSRTLERRYNTMSQEKAFMWAYGELELLQDHQSAIWSDETKRLVEQTATVETITAVDGYQFSLWCVESSSQNEAEERKARLVVDRVRAEHRPSVLITHDLVSGAFAVFFNDNEYIDQRGIAYEIRLNELRKRGLPMPAGEGKALANDEEADGYWYFFFGQTPQGERYPKALFCGGDRTTKHSSTVSAQSASDVSSAAASRLRETVQPDKPKGRAKRAAKK